MNSKKNVTRPIIESLQSEGKGKRVMNWLRIGYTFPQKARVGYDFAKERG
jgi:hypothetical protein